MFYSIDVNLAIKDWDKKWNFWKLEILSTLKPKVEPDKLVDL